MNKRRWSEIALILGLIVVVLTTDYQNPDGVDYLGIVATFTIPIALVLALIMYILEKKEKKQ